MSLLIVMGDVDLSGSPSHVLRGGRNYGPTIFL